MILYATPDDLTTGAWLTAPLPANTASLLRSATVLVAMAAGRNIYGDPALTGIEADALRDATCAQVAAWVKAGIDPTSGAAGEQAPVSKTRLLGDSVEYDSRALADARAQAAKDLCGEATAILHMTGLLLEALPLFDTSGELDTWGLDVPYVRPVPPINPGVPMAFLPLTSDPTKVDGPPNTVASSTTSYAVPFGRRTVFTGSAAQPVTVSTPTVDGTRIEIKVADAATATVTLPAALQLSGVTSMSQGQDYSWFWTASTSSWSIN